MDKRMTKEEFWETLMGILYEQKCAWTSEYQREIDEKTEDVMSYIKSLEEKARWYDAHKETLGELWKQCTKGELP